MQIFHTYTTLQQKLVCKAAHMAKHINKRFLNPKGLTALKKKKKDPAEISATATGKYAMLEWKGTVDLSLPTTYKCTSI